MSLRPQDGFQTIALSTPADIAILGGSAGGGKSWLLEVEAVRHHENPNFGATIFRRTTTQIKAQGGLWDTSKKIYNLLSATPRESSLEWVFPAGGRVKFAHLEYEKDAYNYQGSQIPYIGFDELTHFSEWVFWYMFSRNRTDCGISPYMRATCNPDPNSWVAKLIEWWLDDDGYPIPERSGVLRYFTRDGENMVWGDTKQEVIDKAPHIFKDQALIDSGTDLLDMVKSFTFISGSIYDNKIFIKNDPGYLGVLLSLPEEEKARLLKGNWKVSLDGLMIADYAKVEQIFDNYPDQEKLPRKCITVDAARYGRDFCVMFVWRGWEVIHTVVIKKSDVHDLVRIIEGLRMKFAIQKDSVLIDSDGVGDGTVKVGKYVPFHGGHAAMKDQESRILENYENLITQCYFRFCYKRINTGQVRFTITNENCEVYDDGSLKGVRTTKIKVGGKIVDVKDLIKADFRAAKRVEGKNDGIKKIAMNSKEEKKIILGRSPDFADTGVMREYFELMPEAKGMRKIN
jgi:hypothetical protein